MPNHCENDLYIYQYGEPGEAAARVDEVLRFIGFSCSADAAPPTPSPALLTSGDALVLNGMVATVLAGPCAFDVIEFDFQRVLPVPDDEDEREHWGTKWSAYDVSYERLRPERAVVRFQTAWNPPQPVFEALAAKFPKIGLCLEYFECGAEFCGGFHRSPWDEDDEDPADIREWQGEYKGIRGG